MSRRPGASTAAAIARSLTVARAPSAWFTVSPSFTRAMTSSRARELAIVIEKTCSIRTLSIALSENVA
jgi:hypothetical protein